jgi:putative selenium metabolism hydrolase
MDVVPVKNPGDWSIDPFSGELRDGKIWGRGATDIKGGLAGMVVALGRLPRDEFAGTLILAASVGEETIEGAALQKIVERSHPDRAVIIEPSGCRLGTGQKGRTGFEIQVQGKPAHTSTPERGENAIYKAVEIIQRLRAMTLPQDPRLGSGIQELIEISSTPFPGECTVPYGCRLRYDRRLVSGETPDSVRASIDQALTGLGDWQMQFHESQYLTYTGQAVQRTEFHPGWAMGEGDAWVEQAAKSLAKAGLDTELFTAPYCTNGSYTAGIVGLPTLIFGPSTIRLAHIIDEYVEVEELLKGATGLAELGRGLGKLQGKI